MLRFHPFSVLALLLLASLAVQAQSIDLEGLQAMKARSIGPAGMSGRVTAIDVVLDNPSVMFVGTASGGLWKSESGGTDWTPVFDEQKVASIGAIAIDQHNPDVIWAGTGEGNPRNSQNSGAGIFRSLDGGLTWTCMGLEATRNIHRILLHPDNPNVIYAGVQGSAWGAHPERGVFKSADGGKTWEKILYVNDSTGIADLVMDPRNPNKLIAAMWEFRRWPWHFQSGGEGSGLYVTHDGGQTWTRRTEEDGLPAGPLGRMGLAIARSNNKVVYAYVEAKENAMYRSDDGGHHFRKVGTGNSIGNRPFYYAEIYVDPKNENRVYSLFSIVTRSEDGGKSFQTLLGYVGAGGVHPDHHAFWIHPEDPAFLINGNDGGMAISRDMGATWRFVENLPVAQYYHIEVDNDWPYNVYGGMQDNGSWRGPAYVWRAGGIRNSYFEELYFGDGFDVLPDPANNRYGYAMSQEGYVGRYDFATGATRMIRPVHPDGIPLRFNWNAAIAQDPFSPGTIYFGSQFVHKSTDRGENWTIISPDLTSNDSTKQRQGSSGGLTPDVTGAENHTTILAITPSARELGLIWVGTDDGKLQLTRDGGKTWTDLSSRLPGLPAGSWIPQVHASPYADGEAFVVANNYRRNDWTPYLFHTKDYGQTWTSMLGKDEVWGYCLSFLQDPVQPRLMFLGTEFGLYVSFDAGNEWQRWKHGFPNAPTIDMKIHPREQDLVIGTFGRAAYVLDDIRPLREVAARGETVLSGGLTLVDPPTAVLARWREAAGIRFSADAMFKGENRDPGAMISFFAGSHGPDSLANWPEYVASGDTATLAIFDAKGRQVRTLYFEPDSGLNRIFWDLRDKGVDYPRRSVRNDAGREEPSGYEVQPGTYTLKLYWGDLTDSASLQVVMDPRVTNNPAALSAYEPLIDREQALTSQLAGAAARLAEAKEALLAVEALLAPHTDSQWVALKDSAAALRQDIEALQTRIFGEERPKGYVDESKLVMTPLFQANMYLSPDVVPPSGTAEVALGLAEKQIGAFVAEVDKWFSTEWQAFEARWAETRLPLLRK